MKVQCLPITPKRRKFDIEMQYILPVVLCVWFSALRQFYCRTQLQREREKGKERVLFEDVDIKLLLCNGMVCYRLSDSLCAS